MQSCSTKLRYGGSSALESLLELFDACSVTFLLPVVLQIPEVLLWAKEQNEEKSPNLTQFTEHFNNMSYW